MEPIIAQRRQWQRESPSNWMEEHGLIDLLSTLLDTYPEGECVNGLVRLELRVFLLSFGLCFCTSRVAFVSLLSVQLSLRSFRRDRNVLLCGGLSIPGPSYRYVVMGGALYCCSSFTEARVCENEGLETF